MGKTQLRIIVNTRLGNAFGNGHIERCLRLSDAIGKTVPSIFLFVTNTISKAIERRPNVTNVLTDDSSHYRILETNKTFRPDIIIYDVPEIDSTYIKNTITNNSLVVVFDYYKQDEKLENAHLVFNFHVRPGIRNKIGAELFEGYEFAILRDEFYSIRPNIRQISTEKNILISFGSVDNLNLTSFALQSLVNYDRSNFVVHVILGEYFSHRDEVIRFLPKFGSRLNIHDNVTSMAKIMADMDLAMVGGGVTLYETIHMKIPSIAICAHQYGYELATSLEGVGCIINLGLHSTVTEQSVQNAIEMLMTNDHYYQSLKDNLNRININGVETVTNALLSAGVKRGLLSDADEI